MAKWRINNPQDGRPETKYKVLLGFKAEIDAVDFKRETPLSKAARSGMVEVVEVSHTTYAYRM